MHAFSFWLLLLLKDTTLPCSFPFFASSIYAKGMTSSWNVWGAHKFLVADKCEMLSNADERIKSHITRIGAHV